MISITSLIGVKFAIGRRDCYWLVNRARGILGLSLLLNIDYLGNNYSELITDYIAKHCKEILNPINGTIVILDAEDLALGVWYDDSVLCFGIDNITDLINPLDVNIVKFVELL